MSLLDEDEHALLEPRPEHRMCEVVARLFQRRDRVPPRLGLLPSPAICGKTNHIQ